MGVWVMNLDITSGNSLSLLYCVWGLSLRSLGVMQFAGSCYHLEPSSLTCPVSDLGLLKSWAQFGFSHSTGNSWT